MLTRRLEDVVTEHGGYLKFYGISVFLFDRYTGIPYIFLMENRFDPAKDATNREKHKLSLAFGDEIFKDDLHVIVPTIREEDGEQRFKVIGRVGGKLYTGIFTWRNDLPRFISVRRSNKNEERAY